MKIEIEPKKLNIFCGFLQIPLPNAAHDELGRLMAKEKPLLIQIDPKRKKRSLDANALLWRLCQLIAEKISTLTKEDVYREAIRKVGSFTPLPIKTEAVEEFRRIWSANGVGWVTEEIGESKLKGYTTILAYHGSSTYNTAEMSRLLDYIIDEAKNLGIEIISEADKQLLLTEWGRKETRSVSNG